MTLFFMQNKTRISDGKESLKNIGAKCKFCSTEKTNLREDGFLQHLDIPSYDFLEIVTQLFTTYSKKCDIDTNCCKDTVLKVNKLIREIMMKCNLKDDVKLKSDIGWDEFAVTHYNLKRLKLFEICGQNFQKNLDGKLITSISNKSEMNLRTLQIEKIRNI